MLSALEGSDRAETPVGRDMTRVVPKNRYTRAKRVSILHNSEHTAIAEICAHDSKKRCTVNIDEICAQYKYNIIQNRTYTCGKLKQHQQYQTIHMLK